MRVCGVIAEYNPFHHGHAHHLARARAVTGADFIVCVMSGHFTQRGEAAIVDKWVRAESALHGGADVVIELPVCFAMAPAELFARGGVTLLHSLGVVTHLSFGSESGDVNALQARAAILAEEPEAWRALLRAQLDRGLSYPAAHQRATQAYCAALGEGAPFAAPFAPNDTLGIEYCRAMARLGVAMTPVAIRRTVAHDSEAADGAFASASFIRHLWRSGGALPRTYLPEQSALHLEAAQACGRAPVFPSFFFPMIAAQVRRMASSELALCPDVSEGLENRIKKAAETATSLEALIQLSRTKRYSYARVQRILSGLLLGWTSDAVRPLCNEAPYARILGFRRDAQPLLCAMRERAAVPLVTRVRHARLSPAQQRMMALDVNATDIFALAFPDAQEQRAGQDYTRRVVIIS